MSAGFTPGPWYATNHFADPTTPCNCAYVLSEGYAGGICDISVDNGKNIADGGNDSPPLEEAAANAHLIAAAPELYEALLKWQAYDDQDEADFSQHGPMLLYAEAIEATRAALARARGDQP